MISLIMMIIIPGFFEGTIYQQILTTVLNMSSVMLGIFAIQETKNQLYFGITAALIVTFINQLGIGKNGDRFDFYFSFLIYLIFYAFLAYRLIIKIIATEKVSIGVLYAAALVYLLMGVVGGYIFMLIENVAHGSLLNLRLENFNDPSKFFYFSFTTLVTLGYGDILPVSAPARSISMVLGITGPLYLTILVALLVSRFEKYSKKLK